MSKQNSGQEKPAALPTPAKGNEQVETAETPEKPISCMIYLTRRVQRRDLDMMLRRIHGAEKKTISEWDSLVRSYGGEA